MRTVNLDIAYEDENLEQAIADFLEVNGLQGTEYRIVQRVGPAGGAAVVDFLVPEDRVRALITAYDNGNGEVEYLMEVCVS